MAIFPAFRSDMKFQTQNRKKLREDRSSYIKDTMRDQTNHFNAIRPIDVPSDTSKQSASMGTYILTGGLIVHSKTRLTFDLALSAANSAPVPSHGCRWT